MSRHLRFPEKLRISSTGIALAMILLGALSLRLYNLDWDQGTYLHPDELHVANTITLKIVFEWPPDIGNLLDASSSKLNPRSIDPVTNKHYNYAYGALPLIVTDLTATTLSKITGADWSAFYDRIYKVGRFLSSLADTFTVLFAFLIGRALFSRSAGLAAAAVYATAPVPIQLSHFFTTDTWMTCFATLSLFGAVRGAQTGRLRWFALAGIGFGLAMASKGSVILLGAVIVVAGLCDVLTRLNYGGPANLAISEFPVQLVAAGLGSFFSFALFEPYALVQLNVYLQQLSEQSRIVRGTLDVPFTRQYVGTQPLIYQAEQLLKWGLGPVAGISCLTGAFTIGYAAFKRMSPGAIVLVAWLIGQGAITLLPETKFLRYTEPLLPALAVGAGAALIAGFTFLLNRFGRLPARAAVVAIFLGIAFWTTSFISVYASTNPRIKASIWIYQNIPTGSRLTADTWDLAMPIALAPGLNPADRQLESVSLDLYRDRPPSEVADDIFSALDQTDYIVMSSNRAATAIPRSPWRYPVQSRYFELLDSGRLGFTLIEKFDNPPRFGTLEFDDGGADESFINYDHPTVLIYQKTGTIDRFTYDALMAPAMGRDYSPTRHAPEDTLVLDEPVGDQPVVADSRWSSRITDHTLPAVLVWIVLLVLLQVVGAPIASRLFPRFPDLGWGFARLISTLLGGYLVWILASLELISFRAIWSWVSILLVTALAISLTRKNDLREKVRSRGDAICGAEIAFWGVFLLFLAFRFVNPDSWHPLWGGEKPMEFAHLNAILRSAHFPPFDPWFAGGYINYYYYGLYLVAFWIKLTGIPSEIAFNLAQPTVIALIASTGYSVAAAISRGITGKKNVWLGGSIGAGLLVSAGNLDSALRVLHGLPDDINPTFYEWTWAGSRSIFGGITEFPYFTGLYADLHAHVVAWPITILLIGLAYSIAQQPRVATVALSQGRGQFAAQRITAARVGMVMIALGSLFSSNAWDVPVYGALIVVSIFMATSNLPYLSLRIAITIAISLATAIGSFLLFQPFFSHYVTLYSSLERARSQTGIAEFATHFGGFLTIIALGVVVCSVSRGVRWRAIAIADPAIITVFFAGFAAISIFSAGESHWIRVLVVVAAIAVLTAASLNAALMSEIEQGHSILIAIIVAATGGAIALVMALTNHQTVALATAFIATGAALWLTGETASARFTGLLIAAGASIVAGVEIVFLADDLAQDPTWYRMNTVFKFYNQSWTLFAVAAAVLLSTMIRQLAELSRDAPIVESEAPESFMSVDSVDEPVEFPDDAVELPEERVDVAMEEPNRGLEEMIRRRWLQAGVGISVVLVAAMLMFPLFSTVPRLDLRFPSHPGPTTLNALDWMRYGTIDRPDGQGVISFAGDLDAINWLNENVDGTPVIAEASIGPYRGNGSRFSIATGLPTILGWDRHERQQRYSEGIDSRWVEVIELYDSADPALKMQILRKYDVQYVIVGDVERYSYLGSRLFASQDGIDAFALMVGTDLEIAFQSGNTIVYRVLDPAIPT